MGLFFSLGTVAPLCVPPRQSLGGDGSCSWARLGYFCTGSVLRGAWQQVGTDRHLPPLGLSHHRVLPPVPSGSEIRPGQLGVAPGRWAAPTSPGGEALRPDRGQSPRLSGRTSIDLQVRVGGPFRRYLSCFRRNVVVLFLSRNSRCDQGPRIMSAASGRRPLRAGRTGAKQVPPALSLVGSLCSLPPRLLK